VCKARNGVKGRERGFYLGEGGTENKHPVARSPEKRVSMEILKHKGGCSRRFIPTGDSGGGKKSKSKERPQVAYKKVLSHRKKILNGGQTEIVKGGRTLPPDSPREGK